jgi:hypothetical protein
LAKKSESGYDIEETLERRPGRPKIGSAPARVESVRLEPELTTVSGGWLRTTYAAGVSSGAAVVDATRARREHPTDPRSGHERRPRLGHGGPLKCGASLAGTCGFVSIVEILC